MNYDLRYTKLLQHETEGGKKIIQVKTWKQPILWLQLRDADHTHLVHQFTRMKTQAIEEYFFAEQVHFFNCRQ